MLNDDSRNGRLRRGHMVNDWEQVDAYVEQLAIAIGTLEAHFGHPNAHTGSVADSTGDAFARIGSWRVVLERMPANLQPSMVTPSTRVNTWCVQLQLWSDSESDWCAVADFANDDCTQVVAQARAYLKGLHVTTELSGVRPTDEAVEYAIQGAREDLGLV